MEIGGHNGLLQYPGMPEIPEIYRQRFRDQVDDDQPAVASQELRRTLAKTTEKFKCSST